MIVVKILLLDGVPELTEFDGRQFRAQIKNFGFLRAGRSFIRVDGLPCLRAIEEDVKRAALSALADLFEPDCDEWLESR